MQKRHLFRCFLLLIALTLLLFNDVSKSSAFLSGDDYKQSLPEKLNLLILVKASQSSNHKLSDLSYSKTRLEVIQDIIPSVLEQHPLPPNVNLGIMAYGHLIDMTDFDPSCSPGNVQLVVPFQPASPNVDLEKLLTITGHGAVPTAVALEEAGKVFTQTSPEVLNVILLIADGSDTCAQDPVLKAKELAESKNIVIYTIGFMADTKADKELRNIANQTSGKYHFISPYIGNNKVAKTELTKALSNVFNDLLAQISIPTQTNTPTLEVASLTLTSTDTSIPTSIATEIPPQPTLGPISPVPVPNEEQPIQQIGILLVALGIIIVVVFAFGLLFWRSRATAKIATEPSAIESIITDVERLEQFRKDLFKAYFSIEAKKHYPKFIPLELVRNELAGKYTQTQFDELLTHTRRKYPDNIWIDRDAKNQPVYIKIKR